MNSAQQIRTIEYICSPLLRPAAHSPSADITYAKNGMRHFVIEL